MKVYQIIGITASGKLWQSDICYRNYCQAVQQRIALLKDTKNLKYVDIKELIIL